MEKCFYIRIDGSTANNYLPEISTQRLYQRSLYCLPDEFVDTGNLQEHFNHRFLYYRHYPFLVYLFKDKGYCNDKVGFYFTQGFDKILRGRGDAQQRDVDTGGKCVEKIKSTTIYMRQG